MYVKKQPNDHSACALFAALRKAGMPKVTSGKALQGISTAARRRGTPYGSGFTVFHAPEHDLGRYKAKVFVETPKDLDKVKRRLAENGVEIVEDKDPFKPENSYLVWEALLNGTKAALVDAVFKIHWEMHTKTGIRARFASLGQYSETWKGCGWPEDIASIYEMTQEGDLWIAHARNPTNFLADAKRSHPFHLFDIAVAHNGEFSSDGVFSEFLTSHGIRSFVGTDSEKVLLALHYLVNVEGLGFEKAAAILSPTYEQYWDLLRFQDGTSGFRDLLYRYRGLQLDGSYALILGYTTGNDVQMAGLVQFRPLVMGEDNETVYLASEEHQIREVSSDADVWRCKPKRRVLASMRQGIIRDGRGDDRKYFFHNPQARGKTNGTGISIAGKSPRDILHEANLARGADGNVLLYSANGERYLGCGITSETSLTINGLAGDSTAKLAPAGHTIKVIGGVQDDAFDAAQANVTVDGNVGDVSFYAYQGERAFVRGSGGSQSMVLMRGIPSPLVIFGGRLDDSAGEFMAGGTAVVLGIDALNTDFTGPLIGDFAMSGAVGSSRLYARNQVPYQSIGLQPDSHEVMAELEQALDENLIKPSTFLRASRTSLSWWELNELLPPSVLDRIRPLYSNRYLKPLDVAVRTLDPSTDTTAIDGIRAFAAEFNIQPAIVKQLLAANYTVISPSPSAKK
ncbi:hypothetical protein HYT84_00390 [Candidatus Micrarchaeota archaeon]|nr:hypothetical protein [Candidatus Micrarchaeota archaeon]